MQSAARQIFLKIVVKKFNLQSAARQIFFKFVVKKFNLQSAARQIFCIYVVKKFYCSQQHVRHSEDLMSRRSTCLYSQQHVRHSAVRMQSAAQHKFFITYSGKSVVKKFNLLMQHAALQTF